MNKYDWAKINRAANEASKRLIANNYLDRLLLIQVATSASDPQPSCSSDSLPCPSSRPQPAVPEPLP